MTPARRPSSRPPAIAALALRRALVALVAALLAAAPARADKPKLHLQRVDVERYPTVRVDLGLVESDGRITTGKGPSDFKLVFDSNEQGAAVDVKTVDQIGSPVYLVVVAQVSTVMHEVMDDVKRGIRQLGQAAADLKQGGPGAGGQRASSGSQVALIAYAQDVKRVAEMGKAEAIEGAAAGVVEDTEGTEVHLLDAIRTAIDLLNAKGVPDQGRKLIVVFSDGIDVAGSDKKGFAELGKRANLAGIVIDTIGYAPFDPAKLRNFNELTRQTNGTDRVCKTAQDVSAHFSNTADEIRKQYVVLFQSAIVGDGKEHGIQVLSDSGGAPIYSETVNRICDQHAAPPPPAGSFPWGYLLLGLGAAVLLGLAVWLFIRWRQSRPEAAEEEPMPVAAPAAESRTMAIDLGFGDRGPTIGWIVGMNGRYVDRTFRLKPARTVIGTSGEADIVIEDPKVSRKHCEIRYDGSSFKIADLGSTNGIILNDKRVPTADLVDGDLFRLGGTDFKFKSIN